MAPQTAILALSTLALLITAGACRPATPPVLPPEVIGGIQIQARENTLALLGDLEEDLLRRLAGIEGVSRADAYLEVEAEPDPVVGVAPGSPLQVKGEPVRLAVGEGFPPDEEAVAIPGVRVNANPYGFGAGHMMMAHRFQVGQTFTLQGERLRVVGLYRAERRDLEGAILLPLPTVQRLFGREGRVNRVVLTVEPPGETPGGPPGRPPAPGRGVR